MMNGSDSRPTRPGAVLRKGNPMRLSWIAGVVLAATTVTAQPTVVNSFPASSFGSVFPGGIGYDWRSDNLFVVDETNKVAYELTRMGSLVSTIDLGLLGMTYPIGGGVDGTGQRLYIAEEINDKVWEVDLSNRTVITMISTTAYSDPSGLDFNPVAGTVVTSDDAAGVIHEISLATGQPVTTLSVKALSGDADGLGVNAFNGMYIVGDDTGATILEIADDGFVMNSWASKTYGIQDPEGICMDPQNGNYFVTATVAPYTVYEVSGGLTLRPALTADMVTVPANTVVTIKLRTDSARWPLGGIALVAVGGGSMPPLVLAQGLVDGRGHVTFRFRNPGLGGIRATMIGAGFSTSASQLSTILDITLN